MIIPSAVFAWLVGIALTITVAAPILLLVLLAKDWKNGALW